MAVEPRATDDELYRHYRRCSFWQGARGLAEEASAYDRLADERLTMWLQEALTARAQAR